MISASPSDGISSLTFLAIDSPVCNGLGQVPGADSGRGIQVSYRARHLEDALTGSWRQPGLLRGGLEKLNEAGCAPFDPENDLIESGAPDSSNPTVGSGGGYGGFYCFALQPGES